MSGLAIALCCILVTAFGVFPMAVASASTHGHAIRGLGILSIPVVAVVVIVLAVVANLGWWLVAIAAVPTLLMLIGGVIRDEDGRNMIDDMFRNGSTKRRRARKAKPAT